MDFIDSSLTEQLASKKIPCIFFFLLASTDWLKAAIDEILDSRMPFSLSVSALAASI